MSTLYFSLNDSDGIDRPSAEGSSLSKALKELQMCVRLRDYFTKTEIIWLRHMFLEILSFLEYVECSRSILYMVCSDHCNDPLRQVWFIFLPILQMRESSKGLNNFIKFLHLKSRIIFLSLNLLDSDDAFTQCATLLKERRPS